jgi:hypothetical protein
MHTNTASDILSLAVCVACLATLAPVMGFHSILGADDFGVVNAGSSAAVAVVVFASTIVAMCSNKKTRIV